MKSPFRLLFILLLAAVLNSCSVTIESVKSPEFSQAVNKIYVLIVSPEYMDHYSYQLVDNLKQEFGINSITTIYNVVIKKEDDKLKLNDSRIIDTTNLTYNIKIFNPDVILRIDYTNLSFVNGALQHCDYLATMYDKSSKEIWKGRISTMNMYDARSMKKNIAKELVLKLKQDGIVK